MANRRYQISRRVANERLVRQVDRERNRQLVMVAVTALLLAAAVLAYGWQHFEMIRNGYRMEEQRQEREYLMQIQRQLSLEKASLASPDRIEAIATGELGMMAPSDGQVVVIESYTARADGQEME
ncbi:MAG TPA: cell division protein FtsL [Vicinamibacteria bacterium]|nr:cell division protein FtsL [Vicinamibacteria bacterium]